MAIIGISGSPISDSNTDRMVEAILERSGRETRFLKLSKVKFGSCRACAHNCATTAMCGVKDGLHPYLAEIRDAEALVIGSPNHHGTMTAWMFSFFSRLWCFLHENKTLKDLPVVFVSTGIDPIPDGGPATFKAGFVKEHAFNILGHIYYQSLTPPCFTCLRGDVCQWGGLWRMVGRDVEALKQFKITPDKFHRWEDDKPLADDVEKYGRMLSEL
jgi:multimeric flavodoxin WrbA